MCMRAGHIIYHTVVVMMSQSVKRRRPRGWLDWSLLGVAGYLGYVPGAPAPAPAPDLEPPSEADIQDLYRDLDLDPRLLQGASTAPSAGSPVHVAADLQARRSSILVHALAPSVHLLALIGGRHASPASAAGSPCASQPMCLRAESQVPMSLNDCVGIRSPVS